MATPPPGGLGGAANGSDISAGLPFYLRRYFVMRRRVPSSTRSNSTSSISVRMSFSPQPRRPFVPSPLSADEAPVSETAAVARRPAPRKGDAKLLPSDPKPV